MESLRPLSFLLVAWAALAIVLPGGGGAWAQDAAPAAKPRNPAIFGSIEFIGGNLQALPQWTRVLQKIKAEEKIYAACDKDIRKCPSPGVAAWRAAKRRIQRLPQRSQLRELNRFLNRWVYRADQENYGVEDYWQTPLEFLRKSGDCEDYAIIKYITLRQLGVPAANLRIVVIRDVLRGVAHAVLAVYQNDGIMIMDSLFDAVLPDKKITFYIPQYSVNETTRWAHIMPVSSKTANNSGAQMQ